LVQSFIAKRHALLDVALGRLGCDREVGEQEALLEQMSLVHAAVVESSCNKLLHCDLEDAWQSRVRRVSNSVAASTAQAARFGVSPSAARNRPRCCRVEQMPGNNEVGKASNPSCLFVCPAAALPPVWLSG